MEMPAVEKEGRARSRTQERGMLKNAEEWRPRRLICKVPHCQAVGGWGGGYGWGMASREGLCHLNV